MVLSKLRVSVAISAGLIIASFAGARAGAQESLVRAALILRVFDRLAAQCEAGRGFNESETASISKWKSEQNITAIRAQIRELSPEMQTQVENGATTMLDAIGKKSNANPCALAATISNIPDAKFATATPSSPTKPPKTQTSTNPTVGKTLSTSPASPSRSPKGSVIANLVAKIDSFGFDTAMTFGVGGFLSQDVRPVVLFRNGEALKDVKGLTYAGGLAAHRSVKPKAWTQWRRRNGRVELSTDKGWKKLPFSTTYQSLPNQFRLDGTYRSLSGTGNVAIGGSSSVAAWNTYTFSADGRVVRGGGAGASSGDVVTSSVAPNQRGRYQVEGLILRIRYDDGSVEEWIVIANPKDPNTAIWLDGNSYARRK
jgi:hypothetical protein